MNINELKKIGNSVLVQGAFDESCFFQISDSSIIAFQNAKVKLKVVNKNRYSDIKNLKITFSATRGFFEVYINNSDQVLDIGDDVSGNFDIRLLRSSSVSIGCSTTAEKVRIIADDADVIIGDDCMFSNGVTIQTSAQHGLVDLKSGEIYNLTKTNVKIHDHVWLGRNSTVVGSVEIDEGSIAAIASVVVKDVPRCSVVAGSPAKIVKSETTWSRKKESLDKFSSNILEAYRQKDNV